MRYYHIPRASHDQGQRARGRGDGLFIRLHASRAHRPSSRRWPMIPEQAARKDKVGGLSPGILMEEDGDDNEDRDLV
jgi:hypothetical protein